MTLVFLLFGFSAKWTGNIYVRAELIAEESSVKDKIHILIFLPVICSLFVHLCRHSSFRGRIVFLHFLIWKHFTPLEISDRMICHCKNKNKYITTKYKQFKQLRIPTCKGLNGVRTITSKTHHHFPEQCVSLISLSLWLNQSVTGIFACLCLITGSIVNVIWTLEHNQLPVNGRFEHWLFLVPFWTC